VPSHAQGSDKIDLSAFSAASLNLGTFGSEIDSVVGKQLVAAGFDLTIFGSFGQVIGTPGNDLLIDNDTANPLIGGAGDGAPHGVAGNDPLEGDAGNARLDGGAGDDTYVFAGGNLGSDVLSEADNADRDTLDFSAFAAPVVLDLGSTAPQPQGANLTLTLTS